MQSNTLVNFSRVSGFAFALLILLANFASAHNGRGFVIEVASGKLQAQGINSSDPDGAPAVRPYLNSIHDHWRFINDDLGSIASLPEFEVQPPVAFSTLNSYALDLELISAWKWLSPPAPATPIAPNSIVPILDPLDEQMIISIQTLGSPINTETMGTLQLSAAIPAGGTGDIIPFYNVAGSPSNEIHVLEFILSATAPDISLPPILSSDSIFIILSPDGVGFVERLHYASLYLEEYLATNGLPVPEPSGVASLLFGLAMVFSNHLRLVSRRPTL